MAAQHTLESKSKPFKKSSHKHENHRYTAERRLHGNHSKHNHYSSAPVDAKNTKTSKTTNNTVEKETTEETVKNGDVGSDGEFQTVAPKSARRKEKLKEIREHVESQSYRFKDKSRLRGRRVESNERPRSRRIESNERSHGKGVENNDQRPIKEKDIAKECCSKDKEKEKDKEKDKDGEAHNDDDLEAPHHPVKYIEAPIPTINPWNKRKTIGTTTKPQLVPPMAAAAAVSSGPAPVPAAAKVVPVVLTPVTVSTPAESETLLAPSVSQKPVEKEKRVLQPQQQKIKAGECLYLLCFFIIQRGRQPLDYTVTHAFLEFVSV